MARAAGSSLFVRFALPAPRIRSDARARRPPRSPSGIICVGRAASTAAAALRARSSGPTNRPRPNDVPTASRRRGTDRHLLRDPITRYHRGGGREPPARNFSTQGGRRWPSETPKVIRKRSGRPRAPSGPLSRDPCTETPLVLGAIAVFSQAETPRGEIYGTASPDARPLAASTPSRELRGPSPLSSAAACLRGRAAISVEGEIAN